MPEPKENMDLSPANPRSLNSPRSTQDAPESSLPEPDLTGKTLKDFRILRRLGKGGMGQVYLAEQISLKRKVALKILRPDLAANSVSITRFRKEAEAVAQATHANIVQIYAIDEADGFNFMALEYIEGRNLREFLEKRGPPDLLVGLSIMRQVASALQRSSELGIVHRDIKPENILITRKGEVKVADFGLSRCFVETGPGQNLTQSNITMGTPLYMSPEQVQCKTLDPRSDIYSLGVTCYHMFAGEPPFRGQSPYDIAHQHVEKEPAPLGEFRPDLPSDLCGIVHKMMSKKPEDRYQTGREIVRDLVQLRDSLVGVSPGITPAFPIGPLTGENLNVQSTQTFPRVNLGQWRWLLWMGIPVLALVLGLGAGWTRQWLNQSPPNTSRGNEDPGPILSLFSQKEQEKDLLKRYQKYGHQDDENSITGLTAARDLLLLFLEEKRLEEADRFVQELTGTDPIPRNRMVYRHLGQLGQAMILAFKNETGNSNKKFQECYAAFGKYYFTPPTKGEKLPPPFKGSLINDPFFKAFNKLRDNKVSLREMMARALNHNFLNDPGSFPRELDVLRYPPRAMPKAAPAAG